MSIKCNSREIYEHFLQNTKKTDLDGECLVDHVDLPKDIIIDFMET